MSSHYLSQVTYTRGQKLGEGAFGIVYKASAGDKVYAVKEIKCVKNEDLDDVTNEIRALGKLIHTNIIKLYNVKARETKPFDVTVSLLLEYCGGGDLNERLKKSSSERQNFAWMRQIINAVEFLHRHDILHRDLKPQNVLLTSNDVIKLADFGLATRFARKDDNQSLYDYYIEQGVGQSCYIAPEVLSEHYTYKADIFAVGVMFYAILERTSIVVQSDNRKIYGVFVGAQQPLGIEMFNKKRDINISFSKTRSPAVVELVRNTLKYNFRERPTAEKIRNIVQQNSPYNCGIL
jgi:serine/threonine protein kinase